MRHVIVIGAAGLVLAAIPAAAGGSPGAFKGIVVGQERAAMLVASPSGLVRAIAGRAATGSRISFAGGRVTITGHARLALIRGIVIRRIGSALFLASNRHLVAVHSARRLAAAAATPSTPVPGDDVTVQVTIANNGQLDEDSSDDNGHQGAASVQGVVTAFGAGTVTLSVNGQTVTLPLPAGLTLPASVVGQTVTIQLSFGDDNEQGDDNDQGEQDHQQTTTTTTTTTTGDDDGDHGGDGGGDG